MGQDNKRKPRAAKPKASEPITSHQLFPAVVALWFGALFGLGSLAIRPALLENLVVTSKLDLIVPAAAPPLGMTARMLIALALAAIGAMLGIWIARRLGRTKQEPPVRKRDLRGAQSEPAPARRADYAAPAPVSVNDEIGAADELGGVLAGRRRGALAIEPEHVDFVPHDIAPLPGGAPQMIDPSVFSRPDPAAPTDPFALRDQDHVQDHSDPLDLGHFATPADLAAPAAGLAPTAAGAAPRQLFQPVPVDLPAHTAPSAPAAAQPAETAPQRQIFGMPIADDHVDQQHVRNAGFKTSVFEDEAPQPLFVGRTAPAGHAPEATMSNLAPMPQPHDVAAPAEPLAPTISAGFEMAPAPASVPVASAAPAASAPLSGPTPEKVAMSDLASRLRQSMQQRRAARTAHSAAPVTAAAPQPAPVASDRAPAAMAATTPASFAASPDWSATIPTPAALDPAPIAPIAPVAAATGPEALVSPLAQMPAALRPLDLAIHAAEDDDAMLASLIPPRQLLQDDAAPQQTPSPAVTLASGEDTDPEGADDDDDAYASLLDIGSPLAARGQAVRIDDPDDHQEEIEPVVIFPGQAALATPSPLGAPPAAPQEPAPAFAPPVEATPFRRFDAPSAAGHGGMVAAAGGDNRTDPTEADQALRAALANLQRISGAA